MMGVFIFLILWTIFLEFLHIRYRDDCVYEQQLIDKYQLPLKIYQIYFGLLVIKRFKLPYEHAMFMPFIRYGNIVYQQGSGQALNYLIGAKQVTFLLLGLPIVLSTIYVSIALFLLSGLIFVLIIYNQRYRIYLMYRQKQQKMTKELSHVLFQFVLLVSAGHTIMDAFSKVAYAKEGELYSEMKMCVDAIHNGATLIEALVEFSNRCDDKDIKRMINLLMQTQQKGSNEMSRLFFEMSQINWAKAKTRTLQQAQNASTKLLLPSGIIFLGIIIMMMLPLLINGFLM